MKKNIFDRLSEKQQNILRTTARTYCKKLIQITREDNAQAISVMKETGIQMVLPSRRAEKNLSGKRREILS